ncbi:class I SAM-dependent methyltransferase [bacterium]|nr:class I SAM-dependent methyltransferase [bacterium]
MIKNFYIKFILKSFFRPVIVLFYQYALPSIYTGTKNNDDEFYPIENYKKEQSLKSYNHFKKHFSNSILINDKLGTLISKQKAMNKIREFSIKRSILNDRNQENLYLEFGVHSGKSINYLSKFLKTKIYGFDSFTGLKEDWLGTKNPIGSMDLKGQIPKVRSNVEIIKGEVEDTLEKFLTEKKTKINFVHMDMDVYKSTKYVLQKIKPFLNSGCIILFDELYNFAGWEEGEYKALIEVFKDDEYKYLAFTNFEKVTIQII